MNGQDFFNSAASIFGCLVGLAIIGGLIALAVSAVNKGNVEAKNSELAVNQLISNLPQDKQMMFMMQYNNSRKNSTTAVLLALFLGGLGAHKFYMGQTGLGILYLVFVWTYIPSIIAFIELFTLPGQVAAYNRQKAQEIAMMFGALR